MFVQDERAIILPVTEDAAYIVTAEHTTLWQMSTWKVDGTGRLQITNSGGTSAAEGGMGSGSNDEKEKGELQQPLTGEKGGKPNKDSEDDGWDPIKEDIDEATAKRNKEQK